MRLTVAGREWTFKPVSPELKESISLQCQTLPGLRLVVIFGSEASGSARADSDLDIAFVAESTMADELRVQAQLERSCKRAVDFVNIARANTILKHQIALHGAPIFEANPFEFARFRANAWAEYLDFAPAYEAASRLFLNRLKARA